MILRHEINIIDAPLVQTSTTTTATAPAIALIDPTKYSGTITIYWEMVFSATINGRINLTGGTGSNLYFTSGTESNVLQRLGTLTNTSSFSAGINILSVTSGSITVKSARIIILQDTGGSPLTSSQSQFEIGNQETGITVTTVSVLQKLAAPKYWKYEAANFDGTCTFFGECTYLVSSTTGNKTIVIQEATSAEPTATWTTVATMLNASTGSVTAARVRSSSFTPVDGRYYRLAHMNTSTMSTTSIYNAKIIVDQTGTDITKTEDHYLLANTTLSAGTSLQNFLTKWDSAEWDTTNTYFHQVDAGDNNTSVVEIDGITSGSAVTNSSVSSPDNYKQSTSALTMPSNQNLDVKATTNSGNVFGSRIIVKAVKTAGGGGTLKPFAYGYVIS